MRIEGNFVGCCDVGDYGGGDDVVDCGAIVVIFVVGVAIILIIFFTPLKAKIPFIDFEVKLLFFFLGWILLITADWAVFSKESKMFKNLQAITGSL